MDRRSVLHESERELSRDQILRFRESHRFEHKGDSAYRGSKELAGICKRSQVRRKDKLGRSEHHAGHWRHLDSSWIRGQVDEDRGSVEHLQQTETSAFSESG